MQTKPRRVTFAADGQLSFEFYLADRLHMTVEHLRATMSNQEFVEWNIYHALQAQKDELAAKKAQHVKR